MICRYGFKTAQKRSRRSVLSDTVGSMRWDPYILAQGNEFDTFWKDHLARRSRAVLMIIGRGFDVRACDAARHIFAAGGAGERHAWLLRFGDELQDSQHQEQMVAANEAGYRSLFKEGNIREIEIALGDARRPTATSRNTVRTLSDKTTLRMYDDVILDISAIPRMIALTAIAKLIALLDSIAEETGEQVNLHVTTAESVTADRQAASGSLSDVVTTVVGFSGNRNAESDDFMPRVWFPVLGEDQGTRLTRIHEDLMPNEICPVIPFPSRDPRRGDQIIASYQQTLFDDFQIEPNNILYACEFNPFEAYKQIYSAIGRYRNALTELGGCKAYVSPLSSKLLSVGALLACYNHRPPTGSNSKLRIGMPYVESVSYEDVKQTNADPRELYSMWIRGEWEQ